MAKTIQELEENIKVLEARLEECRKLNQKKNGIARNLQTVLAESRMILKPAGKWNEMWESIFKNFEDSISDGAWGKLE